MFNAHGDVVHLTNGSGTITKDYDYDAFGIEINQDSADNNPFRYCGEYFDKETQTYYLRARYYSPNTGRFISEDSYWGTLEDPLSLNLYVYCANNPIIFVDPSGHQPGDNYMEQYYLYESDYAQVGDYSSISCGTPPDNIIEQTKDKYINMIDNYIIEGIDTVEDIFSDIEGTISAGSQISGAYNKTNFELEIANAIDTDGDHMVQTGTSGNLTIATTPNLTASSFITITNAPNIETLVGVYHQGGVSITLPTKIPVNISIDKIWIKNNRKSIDKEYFTGYTIAIGISFLKGAAIRGGTGNTFRHDKTRFNIIEMYRVAAERIKDILDD